MLATIVVTSADDNGAVDGTVTLREAITSINQGSPANADVVASGAYGTDDTINFDIPGGFAVIAVGGAGLPEITKPVLIDGLTQPGSGPDAPQIRLDGNVTHSGASGLVLHGVSGAVIRGLNIARFSVGGTSAGIKVIDGSGNLIENNFIGINAGGFVGGAGQDRNRNGVTIQNSNDNTISGNLISGNVDDYGVLITGSDNRVVANRIGTDKLGLQAVPNRLGVNIASGVGNVDRGQRHLRQ